jgi:hypothetical protein
VKPTHLIRIFILGSALLSIPSFGMEKNDKQDAKTDIDFYQRVMDIYLASLDLELADEANNNIRHPPCELDCDPWPASFSYFNASTIRYPIRNLPQNNFSDWHYPRNPWTFEELGQRPDNSDDEPAPNVIRKYYVTDSRNELGKVTRTHNYWIDYDADGNILNSDWIPKITQSDFIRTNPDFMWQPNNQVPKEPGHP